MFSILSCIGFFNICVLSYNSLISSLSVYSSQLVKTSYLLPHFFIGQKSRQSPTQLVLCLESHKAEINMSARPHSFPNALGMNLLPSSFRLLAKFSSLQLGERGPCFITVSQRPGQATHILLHALYAGPQQQEG